MTNKRTVQKLSKTSPKKSSKRHNFEHPTHKGLELNLQGNKSNVMVQKIR